MKRQFFFSSKVNKKVNMPKSNFQFPKDLFRNQFLNKVTYKCFLRDKGTRSLYVSMVTEAQI